MTENGLGRRRQRDIIDRNAVADEISSVLADSSVSEQRSKALAVLQATLREGREEISRRLIAMPSSGRSSATDQAFLIDQIIRIAYDFVTTALFPVANRSAAEKIAVVAVGGYGRGEMAPHSDVDIAFITPYKRTGWTEQVVEAMLYFLWDLGLKVGQSSRSIDETIKMALEDLTIRTALLEGRFVWGDREVYEEASIRFWNEVATKTGADFVAQKMIERDERHKRMGDSRYVVEPNVKDGKGGLRDLHTLYWIGKYVHRVRSPSDLVEVGLLTREEYRKFEKAENFLWAVRCHMHDISGRAEDRLTFDLQREVAERMRFSPRPGRSAVERFMQLYFLNAKTVGDLTGLFLAHLDEALGKKGRRFLPSFARKPRKLNGFVLDRGRLALPSDDFFQSDPIRLIELFNLADLHALEIHPLTMRAARRDARLIDHKVRQDARANQLFLDTLCSPRNPEAVLRWMNEATVFGRFIPDFGRVVAQMQFDMYHHYTVDEHSIRAIGLLAEIERGDHKDDHPLSTAIVRQIVSRRVLFVAVLLHDIAKGRGGDHSVLGAEVALNLCPRLGLNEAETETVAWLVRHHLLMSATAFKRDLSDFKTILDFAQTVTSAERLRLLLVLTVVDIRAVGPGVWNSWKRQLLSDLFEATEEVLRLGHKQKGREERIASKKSALQNALKIAPDKFKRLAKRMPEAYWIAEPDDIIERNIRLLQTNDSEPLVIDACYYPDRGATLITVLAADHPGLFYRIAGAIHLAGGSIIDARIHTSTDGLAVDNFLVQDPWGRPFQERDQIERLKQSIGDALANKSKLSPKLMAKPVALRRAEAFKIAPSVLMDNKASNRFTVIEVNAADRPALLNNLALALFQSKVTLHSAHIATYGERAVDTFYVTDLFGGKIESKARLKALESRLLEAATGAGHGLKEVA
ncbi:[protein-PII] uridylyltransferase [Sphingorhabdus pulchriflava]|uniref:Bifunctional uridylyltransferase/uridylyl-removing enzyme n=1 Tax=Sphingorhabdus pulchriflava TaxID=2292257 RepID=A0A371BFB1_9SPHN|nr:[protein-PII] uridylyltransferase [Sphingorhabdus pulchriflava]RDV06093.1 [protein-PII] uridylyltransferase [Sphingorhabdus pulchriflava]